MAMPTLTVAQGATPGKHRAKAEGRNRVAPAPLVMLETRGNAARLPVDIGAGTALAAPMAG
jgi:hypothetical protein